ncbi:electron transfer flavoprotein subunit beta/FixA family protein [Arthrobacter sp. lap29]|uniref:electron transfer flavoprotein subunit beta/FixA family protein n=1 Tax=Arthrobacter sp. lap29 TaxID=3056122 RepID=UPI0028F6D8B1|nr:electron transfer flavoprotein subunit beta/FixA family protein [Arthrobacter sp. lap29]
MKIAVLIKQVPDTADDRKLTSSGAVDRSASDRVADEITERALEIALREKDADKSVEIVAVTMGPGTALEALRKALSMGADSAIQVVDDALAGADALTTARELAGAMQGAGFDLIVAGNESTDGRGGVVPAMVAELLGRPFLGSLDTVVIKLGTVSGQRQDAESVQQLTGALPAVISITESSAEARFPKFKGIMTAKRKPVAVVGAAVVGAAVVGAAVVGAAVAGAAGFGTAVTHANGNVVLSTTLRPARTAGLKLVDDGTAATQLADFLSAENLI